MLPDLRDYQKLRSAFRWQIPARYNIGVDACDKWALREPGRTALLVHGSRGLEHVSYGRLRDQSNRLANGLKAHGIARGDARGSAHENALAGRRPCGRNSRTAAMMK